MLLLTLVLSVAPVAMAMPGVSCVGLDQKLCDSFADRLVAGLSEHHRARVLTSADVAVALGMERQRQLNQCARDSGTQSCIAELSAALGAEAILLLTITRSEPYYVSTARVLRARDGSAWVTTSQRVKREGEVFDSMDAISATVTEALGEARRDVPSAEASSSTATNVVPWVPAIAGVAAAGVGVAVFLSASTERSQLVNHSVTGAEATATAQAGRLKEGVGVGLMIAGGTGVVASTVWLVAGRSEPVVMLAPLPGGAALSISGVLP
jgi:hypothetical protein